VARLRRLGWVEIVTLIASLSGIVLFAALQAASSGKDVTGSSYDASDSGMRAYYELLAREHIPVRRFTLRPFELKRAGIRTLIVALPAGITGWSPALHSDADDFKRFVVDGGTLVLLGACDRTTSSILLLPGVARVATSEYEYATRIDLRLRKRGIRVIREEDGLRYAGLTGSQILLADRYGAFAIVKPEGAGQIVATTSPSLFFNSQIGQNDNARLAYALATIGNNSGDYAFDEQIHGFGVDRPWWALLPAADRAALAILGVAAVLWLLASGTRLGLPVAAQPPPDPTSKDYLDSLAGLHARARTDALIVRQSAAAVSHFLRTQEQRARFDDLLHLQHAESTNESVLIRTISDAVALRKEVIGNAYRHRTRRTTT